ncbi:MULTISPECIES: TnsA endonuclease C-terminal domain-containing protein [Brevibacillus]|uniref:TnsA endonuclease C-terminal domain-containing protein n=1 Tax=Brevibacillus TaxID=55080 RepID=UPI001D0AB957|nr:MULTISPECIES: TnsA endonuclease C-terminal domain-containing protein [Brevibacillus]MCC0567042.1 TnsA endonuclease C-terminal domain-containing protein [Brevibacillus borstelensis]MCM3473395.1 TnsA endonuclease C-terminal domain-containing protein [Brevibacillus borstelensis]MDN4095642.1 TnsA endonuclease C-terminal domain-containing protein [Brevibacillus agri]
MARSSDWTEAKFKRFLAEGRGRGKKESYRPWLLVSDLPSRGRSTRLYSNKANRIVHLLTDTQLRYFYLLEWDESTTDINEQYPLLDMETIMDQLDEPLLKRLKDRNTSIPHIMLTTFLVTAINEQGKEYQFARTIKDAAELGKKATIERLELQRRYWKSRKIEFGIITPNEIPIQRSKNIEWVLPALNIEDYGLTEPEMIRYAEQLLDSISSTDNPLNSILDSFDRQMKVEVGTGLLVFRHLIASRKIQINMDMEIKLDKTPSEIGFIVQKSEGRRTKHVIGS